MIEDRDRVFDQLDKFTWQPKTTPLQDRVQALKQAIIDSVFDSVLRENYYSPIHVALSGGIDSSLIVTLLCQALHNCEVVTHTIASSLDHPDMVHAKLLAHTVGATWIPHLITPQPEDLDECISVMGPRSRVDNYWYLFRAISQHTKRVLTCDCIDELLGGYYKHKNSAMFEVLLAQLRPNHLEPLDQASTHWGVTVRLPYADKAVLAAASVFDYQELVNGSGRKQSLYTIAKEVGVPSVILTRRKYGLISAINQDEGRMKVA